MTDRAAPVASPTPRGVTTAARSGLGLRTRLFLVSLLLIVAFGAVSGTWLASNLPDDAAGLRELLLAAGLIGLGVAVFMSGLASHLVSRELRLLVRHAREAVDADRPAPVPSARYGGELAWLAGSFNRPAEELEANLDRIAGARDQMHAVIDAIPDAVLAIDADGVVQLANRGALAMLGLERFPVGRPIVELLRAPEIQRLLAGALDGDQVVFELPPRQVLARRAPMPERGTVLVLRDVTELRRLERMRRDFLTGVSHELKTPIAIIQANTETLLDGALDDPEHGPRFVEATLRNAQRLGRLVTDLLDLSRLEAGRYPIHVTTLDLSAIASRVHGMLVDAAEARDHTLRIEFDEQVLARGDAAAVEHVLTNLVSNAIRYTPVGGQVVVRVIDDPIDDCTYLEVEDDGPGIDAVARERIFERFYRVDASRARDGQDSVAGTGLGLAIVKHLVAAMDGAVDVEPVQPHGSLFRVRLPSPVAANQPSEEPREVSL